MKKLLLLSIIFIGLFITSSTNVYSQGVGINNTGNPPDPSAGLDVDFTNKGTLITRMSTGQRNSINSLANGLLIFNTDCDELQFYQSATSSWVRMLSEQSVAVPGPISGSSSVCKGQTGVSYSIPAIIKATSYIWSYSGTGATISGDTNPVTINFSSTATSGNLTVRGSNLCGLGTISAGYFVSVNDLPATTATSNSPVPETYSLSLAGGPASMSSYTWSGPNSFSSSIQNPTVSTSATLAMAGIYTLTVTNSNGCSATVSATVEITRILLLRPVGVGFETAIPNQTPASGAHWDKVAEVVCDNQSTMVKTQQGNSQNLYRDLYAIADHTTQSGTIFYIKEYVFVGNTAQNYGPGIISWASIRIGGATYDGDISNIGNGRLESVTWTTNPSTGIAWTWAEVDALQAGVKLKDWSFFLNYCSQVYVEVNYQ